MDYDNDCTCGDFHCQDCYPIENRRMKDARIVQTWKEMERSGDPPPFVQHAFDRENVRILK